MFLKVLVAVRAKMFFLFAVGVASDAVIVVDVEDYFLLRGETVVFG